MQQKFIQVIFTSVNMFACLNFYLIFPVFKYILAHSDIRDKIHQIDYLALFFFNFHCFDYCQKCNVVSIIAQIFVSYVQEFKVWRHFKFKSMCIV